MYKLIVVDDERRIRDGVSAFINKANIGVECIASLSDGREAIEFLAENQVDIVITDIKMTHVSGLELSKHIHENYPSVKIVVISGYKEFEYARQAIQYDVKNYIIKPTKPDEILKILKHLKDELDTERNAKERDEKYEELIPLLREEFLNDILIGGLSDEAEINRKISLLGMDPNILDRPCVVVEVLANENNPSWEYGKEGLQNFFDNLFIDENSDAEVYKIALDNASAKFCLIAKNQADSEKFSKLQSFKLKTISQEMKKITDIIWKVNSMLSFDSLKEACNSDLLADKSDVYLEKSKILFSHILSHQEKEAHGIFSSMIQKLSSSSINEVIDFTNNIFQTLFDKLKESGRENFNPEQFGAKFKTIKQAQTVGEVTDVANKIISEIISNNNQSAEDADLNILKIAQKYIEENYAKDISLSDVATKVYLSPVYFSRFFKKHTGENFSDYLVRVRMTHAVEFLKQNHKVEDVSKMSGYNSSRYFYRTFKAYYGCSPKEYARNNF